MNQCKSCTVFIGNIPYDAQEDDLKNIFSRVGAVDSLRLVYDKDTKQPKGYGFCDYVDPDTALSAIRNLNDVECNGRRLRIDLADNVLRSRELGPKAASPLPVPLPTPGPPPAAGAAATAQPSGPQQLALPMPPGVVPLRAPEQPGTRPGGSPSDSMAGGVASDGVTGASTGGLGRIGSIASSESAVSAHTEIAQIVSGMPQAQLQLCLGAMQRLALETPENARTLLQDNPQLCYALLHGQLLLGLTMDPSLPPSGEEMQELRTEAIKRPATLPAMVPPGAGVVVPPSAPGLPGGPPRPILPGLTHPGLIGANGPRLPPAISFPVRLPGGQATPPRPLTPVLGTGAPGDIGLAPKGAGPRPSSAPGVVPRPTAAPRPLVG